MLPSSIEELLYTGQCTALLLHYCIADFFGVCYWIEFYEYSGTGFPCFSFFLFCASIVGMFHIRIPVTREDTVASKQSLPNITGKLQNTECERE